MNSRNIDILEHIISYCEEIKEAHNHFGNSLEALKTSSLYRNAVSMCILQIGELVAHLSEEFKSVYTEIPWQKIRGMRNIAAHQYGNMDLAVLYKTATDRIPELQAFCEQILRQKQLLEQEAKPDEEIADE